MYRDFKTHFGYCIIPKNTLLFRAPVETETEHCMFFALRFGVASIFGDIIQVWKVTNAIEVLFLIDSIKHNNRLISAIPELYKMLNPNDGNVTDLDVKCTARVFKFAKDLYLNGERGFFSNVEGDDLEICLFGAETVSGHLQQIEVRARGDKKYFKNSLRKFKLFPSDRFYQKTTEAFNARSIDHNQPYKKHVLAVRSWVRDEANTPEDAVRLREYYYDLRLKLKI